MAFEFGLNAKKTTHSSTKDMAFYQARALSDNTHKAYLSDARNFTRWLINQDVVSDADVTNTLTHLTLEQVLNYLENQAQAINTRSLYRRMMGLSKLIDAQGLPNPIQHEEVKKLLAGIKRVNGKPARKVEPLMINTLIQLVDFIDSNEHSIPVAVRDKALILLAFGGALRRSELVSINHEDLLFSGQGVRLTLYHTKTDTQQVGQTIAIPYAKNTRICPVRALREWLSLSEIRQGPVFRPFSKGHKLLPKRLTDHGFYKILKMRLASAGFDPRLFAGHSPRRGLITEAAIADVKEHKILAQSRHKSRVMLDEYIKDANLFKDNAAGIL
jgi:integrase